VTTPATAFSTVLRKEVIDNGRDRRSLLTALLSPLLGPLSLVLMFFVIADAREKAEAPKVPVVGREHAPVLVGCLEGAGVVVQPAPADPEDAVRRGEADVVVVIDAGFAEALRAGRPAVVELIVDESRQAGAATVGRVRALLEGYGAEVGALRLLARGVDPSVGRAVSVQSRDVGTPTSKAAMLLAVMPLFLLMACFMGGTYVAIDVTAGERERGSIEALLMNPVSPTPIVLGKIAAVFVFGIVGIVVAAAGFVVAVAALPFETLGIRLGLSPLTALGVVAMLLPVVVLGSALQVAVGVVSRSFKTAQAAISFVMLLPTLPGAALSVFPQQPSVSLMAIPTVGHNILMTRLVRGEPIEALHVVVAGVVVLALAVVFTAIAVKLFGPRLVVGR
jgi:sodium transport system permease protein